MDIKRLGLVNEWSTIGSHLKNVFLLDFPNSSVPFFDVSWDIQVLNISINKSLRAQSSPEWNHYLARSVVGSHHPSN